MLPTIDYPREGARTGSSFVAFGGCCSVWCVKAYLQPQSRNGSRRRRPGRKTIVSENNWHWHFRDVPPGKYQLVVQEGPDSAAVAHINILVRPARNGRNGRVGPTARTAKKLMALASEPAPTIDSPRSATGVNDPNAVSASFNATGSSTEATVTGAMIGNNGAGLSTPGLTTTQPGTAAGSYVIHFLMINNAQNPYRLVVTDAAGNSTPRNNIFVRAIGGPGGGGQ